MSAIWPQDYELQLKSAPIQSRIKAYHWAPLVGKRQDYSLLFNLTYLCHVEAAQLDKLQGSPSV